PPSVSSLLFTLSLLPCSPHSFPPRRSSDLFCLYDASVLPEGNGLDAALPAEIGSIRMPVIENIPFSHNLHHTAVVIAAIGHIPIDRKSTRLNSSHVSNSYAVSCLKKDT